MEATRLLGLAEAKPYRHIIVNEAQDLSSSRWRMLRAAVPSGPDDIFLVGDTHQRIYDHCVSLKQIGIAARSSVLVDEAVAALAGSGVAAISLAKRATGDGEVAAATMHRMKGLEFRCVAVPARTWWCPGAGHPARCCRPDSAPNG